MPHHTAFSPTIGTQLADARQQSTDAKKLLVARHDLAHLAVEQHIATQERQQPLGREQADQQAVLLGGLHGGAPQRVEVISQRSGLALKQRSANRGCERCILERQHVRIVKLFLSPLGPKFGRCVRGAVAALGLADGHQQLGIGKQVGDFVRPLVAQVLADALGHHGLGRVTAAACFGSLGLDHHERDAVHVGHHIGRAVVCALCGQDFQLFGHVPTVGRRVGPVDQVDGGLVFFAIGHELGHRDTQSQLTVQPLIGGHEAFGQVERRQLAHNLVDAAGREWKPFALVFVAPGLQHLDQPGLEQHLAGAAAQCQRLRRGQKVPAQVAQQVQRGQVGAVLFAGVGGDIRRVKGHFHSGCSSH